MRVIWAAIFMLGLSVQGAQAQTMKPFMGLVFPENTTEESRAIIQRCWNIELGKKTSSDKWEVSASMELTRDCLWEEIREAWYNLVDYERDTIDQSMQALHASVRDLTIDAFVGYKGCPETDCDYVFVGAVAYEQIRVFQRVLANLYWQKEAYKEK